jgi:hypothetical protein
MSMLKGIVIETKFLERISEKSALSSETLSVLL